jgi:hypothetical protein
MLPLNISVGKLSLPHSLPLSLTLPLSHQPVTSQLVTISNMSLSPILNQVLSHGSYTNDTSQLDVQHHQHIPLPSMYQYHQHTITIYVSQPCTKPSTCTIPNINHVPQHVHQPCTTPIPNCASTMHHDLYHIPQPSTMYTNTIPSINHVPYHVPTMHINHNKCLNHIPYHAIHHIPI